MKVSLVMSCVTISYINTIHVGVRIAIMMLQYEVIYECCFDRGIVCLFLLPFGFFMEQSYYSELVVVMFHNFCVSRTDFLYFMGLSTFRISTSGFVMCQSVFYNLRTFFIILLFTIHSISLR
jgi:hypothetical protein